MAFETIPSKTLNGISIPTFGIGTWEMGGRLEADKDHDAETICSLQKSLEMGITHIDTAEAYGKGHAEVLVGKAIKGFNRSSLFLTSKVIPEHLKRSQLITAVENSLKRLQTDYLDLYLIHRPNPAIPLEESMAAMNELVDRGLVKQIGVSNFTPARLKEAQHYSRHKIVANQVHYNLLVREVERAGVLKQCQEEDRFLIAWRPIEKGSLADSPLLQKLASKYQKTALQVAINWLISQNNVVVIVKNSQLSHLQENLGALGWKLSDLDIETLRNEFPNQLDLSPNVPLS